MSENHVIEEIKSTIAANTVVIFMKGTAEMPHCGFSAQAAGILQQFPYPFTCIDILERQDIRAALPGYSQWPTFPQIFVKGELIGGCDILTDLYQSGELAKILENAFSAAKS